MQDFRAIVQDSWGKAVLAVSSVEDHAQAMVGEARSLIAELTPEGAQKLAVDVSSALREHRRQLVEQVEGAVRRGLGQLKLPARADLAALGSKLDELEAKLAALAREKSQG